MQKEYKTEGLGPLWGRITTDRVYNFWSKATDRLVNFIKLICNESIWKNHRYWTF